jgi:hypothetical protein
MNAKDAETIATAVDAQLRKFRGEVIEMIATSTVKAQAEGINRALAKFSKEMAEAMHGILKRKFGEVNVRMMELERSIRQANSKADIAMDAIKKRREEGTAVPEEH